MRCLLNNPGRLPLTNAAGLQANTCNAVSSSSFLTVAKLGLALRQLLHYLFRKQKFKAKKKEKKKKEVIFWNNGYYSFKQTKMIA